MKTRLNFCPCCLSPLDAAQGVTTDGTPNPGDFTICAYCLVVLRFGENLVVEIPQHVPAEVQIVRTQFAAAKMRAGWMT
jgi:hypothetical protein